MSIVLGDDGTMDTVVRCSICGEEIRGTDTETETDAAHNEWVKEFIDEVESEHECQTGTSGLDLCAWESDAVL